MPIAPEHRWFYPIDWPELSNLIRFRRAKGRCEHCQRPHGRDVLHLGNGTWWDEDATTWREAMHGPEGVRLLRGALDLVWRVEALIALNDEADGVLARAVELTLTREELHLSAPEAAVVEEADGEAE